jgi:hypothetical protein
MYGRGHLDVKENMKPTFLEGGGKGLVSAPRYQIPSRGKQIKQCHCDPNRYADK